MKLSGKGKEAMMLVKPRIAHYKAVMAADQDFEAAGEEPYCGSRGRMGYLGWLALIDRQSKPECLNYGSNPNEIYFLMDGEERILGFGQLRPYDTRDSLTWAGHIGYSVPPSQRGRGYAQELLARLLDMGFARGMDRILLTCDEDNDPSRHVIEKAGGCFAGFYRDKEYDKRQYWFYQKKG